jgi:hypothetical protein
MLVLQNFLDLGWNSANPTRQIFVGSRPAVAYWLSRPQLNNPTGADGGVVAADPMATEGPVKGVACTALHSRAAQQNG